MQNTNNKSFNDIARKIHSGFTIVELLIVVAIIGVLTTIGIISYSSLQSDTRDSQRSSKITLLSEALEKYYDKNGAYPVCAALITAPDLVATNVLKGIDPDLLTTPTAVKGTNSILCANPTLDTFAYIGGGSEYTLKYKEEGSGIIKSLESRHRVATTSVTYTLTLVASNGGTVSGGGTFAAGSGGHTITANANPNYSFSSWTGSPGCPGTAIHDIAMDGDANKTCTANFSSGGIATPSTPTVTPSTVGATTTFSWGAASCGGNSARYQYRYTVSPAGYDSGLVATAATAIGFTTSTEGQTYTVAVQAECYNAVTSSGMSVAGLGSYDRPFTLTYVAGANCSLTGNTTQYVIRGGNGTAVTVNPATYYSFGNAGSSWTGGSIANPRTDTNITANISVTANCMPTIITPPPPPPTVSASTVGSSTTFSWPATSCGSNTARYHYRYTILPSGYDSDVPTPTAPIATTSVTFTTSTEGQTYKVVVQAECYNAATGSGMSAFGTTGAGNPYYRPVPQCTLTLNAGANGTVSQSGSGTYNCGDTPTMTASPNTYYSFGSWSGDNGCSTGGASHTILMDVSKICSVNFPVITITPPPPPPVVSGSTVGASTTFSWPATSCGSNTARYNYVYTILPSGYNSGSVATAATSVTFTTSTEGQTYKVLAQAECYNAATGSGMSAYGTTGAGNPYYRHTGALAALGTIATGFRPYDITISANGTSVYVVNEDNTISMYSRNTGTGALTAMGTIATGLGDPYSVTISTDGTSVYVANRNGIGSTISMYSRNTGTGALTSLGTIATGNTASDITISADGTSVYTNGGTNTISMHSRNTGTGALTDLGTIATGLSPYNITISANGTSVYVTNSSSNTISMYSRNTGTGALTALGTIATGVWAHGITISADGTSVYVANADSSPTTISMYFRNAGTGALTALGGAPTIAGNVSPYDITISADGTSVYVANSGSNTIGMYSRNTGTGALTALGTPTIATGGVFPRYITISADGNSVYATNYGSNIISMYSRQ